MSILVGTQDPSAVLDWTLDWTAQLAANGSATISGTPTVTVSGGATASAVTVTSGTKTTFRLTTSAVTGAPTVINCVVHVVLSTGEQDERTLRIQVTDR